MKENPKSVHIIQLMKNSKSNLRDLSQLFSAVFNLVVV